MFTDGNKHGTQEVVWGAISCPNPGCREYTLSLEVHDYGALPNRNSYGRLKLRYKRTLVPEADVQVMPDYLPVAVLADYKEACLIAALSPKASATLSRRCLQGMIRDFWGVTGRTLFDEIEAIEEKVDKLTWDAIDAVRNIGNIGAHMEKDINVIVDVEPNEAKLLIGLIETLVDEWYVARHDREERFSKLIATAQNKKAEAKNKPADPI